MFNKFIKKIKSNTEIAALVLLLFITILSTTYYNFNKKKIFNNYKNTINNVYFKKTVNEIFNQLEPKFKKITHKIIDGESFDQILENYSVDRKEINNIKKKLSKKINLNKLNTNQKIQFTIDQTNNVVKNFTFQTSTTEKIYLSRNDEINDFNQQIIATKLKKEILYKENIILNSLYKSAVKKKVPANTIVEFARIFGFEVDFQRDIRKRDSFQIMLKF